MQSLRLEEEPSAQADLALVRVIGTFDVATLPQFESLLKRLRGSGRVKVVVDLSRLDYVSSSGLGAFLGTVDAFRALGGDLVFTGLTERIQKIFKVVGFTRVLTVMAGEEEALRHFRRKPAVLEQVILSPALATPHSGEAFELEVLAADGRGAPFEAFNGELELRASTGMVSPARVGPFKAGVWHGKVVLTGPGPTTLRGVTGTGEVKVAGEITLQVLEDKPPAVLPLSVACPGCAQAIVIHAFNVYRCHGCDEIYFVDKWGHGISLKKGRKGEPVPPKRFTLGFPADVNLLSTVRHFLTSALREYGYPQEAINDLEMSADEAVTNVVEHAYEYDSARTVRLEFTFESEEIQVRIKDDGRAFNPLEAEPVNLDEHIAERRTGGLGVHLMQSLMDGLDYRREGNFNVLTLIKKGRAA